MIIRGNDTFTESTKFYLKNIHHPIAIIFSFKTKERKEWRGRCNKFSENLIRFRDNIYSRHRRVRARFYPKTVLPVQMGRRSNRVVCGARSVYIYIYVYI